MELRHLRYFVAVAEEQHMTRAALRLGIQQPPLSSQIRDLERELGVQLFDRSPRSIRLNAAGQVFLKEAQALLQGTDQAVLRVRQAARGESGSIAIGYTSSASLHAKTPKILRAFQSEYPMINVVCEENTTRDLLDSVASKALDAAFIRSHTERYPELRAVDICNEALVVAVPIDHPLAVDSTPVSLSVLTGEDFILYRKADGPGVHDIIQSAFRNKASQPRIVMEVSRLLSAVTMVAAGRGIAIVPECMKSLHAESVVYREIEAGVGLTVPLTFVCRESPSDSPVSRFSQWVKKYSDF